MAMIACFDMDGGRGGFTNGFFAHGFDIDSSGGSDKVSPANARVEPADRFAAGAPSVVPEDAPRPEHFPTGRTHAQIVALFAGKSQRREQGIARVLEDARAKGKPVDRFVACITYDSEFAPKTTNRRQLLELGIMVPASDSLPKSAADVHRCLWTILYGLARLGIYLTGTDGFDDRALLAKLCATILVEEINDIPPSADMSEFIDVDPIHSFVEDEASLSPDGLSGPFDFGSNDEDEEFGAQPRLDRDRLLPRPDRR